MHNSPAVLGRDRLLALDLVQHYRVVEGEEARGPWKVSTVAYYYTLTIAATAQEVLGYHWHPQGRSNVMYPHLHLYEGAGTLRHNLRKAHLPTGRIAVEDILRLAIAHFLVTPLRKDWEIILAETQDAFQQWRAWGGSHPHARRNIRCRGLPMARLTKTEAARQLGIARSTLYKLIDQGAISPTPDGLIDSTELVRAATLVDRLKHRSQAPSHTRQTSANIRDMDTQRRGDSHHGHVADSDHERPQTPVRERQQTSGDERSQTYADIVVDLLREQLRKAQEDAQQEREAAQERERAYREHMAHLTVMLDQAHQQN